MTKPQYDVLIIGAGASGLACAQVLAKHGLKIAILEAKKRIGGRVYSRRVPGIPAVELGAEFLHGAQKEILTLLNDNGLPFVDARDSSVVYSDGRLVKRKNPWNDIEKVDTKLRATKSNDRSIQEFLHNQKQEFNQDVRNQFSAFVEGFYAADLNLIGEKYLALAEKENEPELNKQSLFRPLLPYQEVLTTLIRDTSKNIVHLEHTVKKINWNDRSVKVQCLHKNKVVSFTARHVILCVPLGVLLSEHPKSKIEFAPEIPKIKRDLATFEMGHVQKIILKFRSRFWESLADEPIAFFRAGPECYFPTWWTQSPLRTSYLVAWQGGPRALEMSTWNKAQKIQTALDTLAKITGRKKQFLTNQLEAFYTHNWTTDPYTLGAYSYTKVQQKTPPRFNKPYGQRIWISGEATAKGSAQGTVHGAIRQGQTVASHILKYL